MRGVAAITVVLFHGARLAGVQTMPHGYLAVDMFFALSGFVISRAYDRRLAADWTPLPFFRLRLVRFYPLYALGLALGATREMLLLATHNHFALPAPLLFGALAAAALFLPFPLEQRDNYLFAMNPPSWSLLYELLVNVAYGTGPTGPAGAVEGTLYLRYGTASGMSVYTNGGWQTIK